MPPARRPRIAAARRCQPLIRFARWLALIDTPPDVAVAQAREFARHVPAIYLINTANAALMAWIVRDAVPGWLSIAFLTTLLVVVAGRQAGWGRLRRRAHITPAAAIAALRGSLIVALAVMILDIALTAVVGRYVAIDRTPLMTAITTSTVTGGLVCMMYLPQVALAIPPLTVVLLVPLYWYFGRLELAGVMLYLGAITTIMGAVISRSFATFTALVRSRSALETNQREAQRLNAENAAIANLDSLTGLPNRRLFFARLDALVAERQATGVPFAVGLLDLDRFKPVNDTYGHLTGDRLLAELGRRLRDDAGDLIVARLGGDEFGLLLPHILDDAPAAAAAAMQRICDVVLSPFRIDDLAISIGCSCGLALFPYAGRSGRELIDRADYALYHRKSTVRGGISIFSADHERSIRSGQILEAALQTADLEREMSLVYQPIVDTHHMTVVSVEALARWHSPVLGTVPPDQFVPVAENLGTIGALTLTLLRKALADARLLPPAIGLSFNLSANDIGAPATVEAVIAAIAASPIDPARITLEVTETAMMRDFDVTVAAIERLCALGIEVALDDFGTGFSSLTHLRRLPIGLVKIDRSFAADLEHESGIQIVSAISGLCGNLGLDCVIEGIEHEAQLLRLRQLGYRFAQGYLFARPMPMDALVDWLAGHAPGHGGGALSGSGRSLRSAVRG